MKAFLARFVDDAGRRGEQTVLARCTVDALLFVLEEQPGLRMLSVRPV